MIRLGVCHPRKKEKKEKRTFLGRVGIFFDFQIFPFGHEQFSWEGSKEFAMKGSDEVEVDAGKSHTAALHVPSNSAFEVPAQAPL